MVFLVKWLVLLFLTMVHTQSDPRKRFILDSSEFNNKQEDISCSIRTCYKRSNQDDMGPFWANRGKKDPTFHQDPPVYVDEPHWVLVRRNQNSDDSVVPFFTSRGKKETDAKNVMRHWVMKMRNRRFFNGDDIDPAFFAARGKKMSSSGKF